MTGDDLPLVSVVIPSHNRKDKLLRLLDSIMKSDYPVGKMEVIVVDSSTDGTSEAVKARFPLARVLRSPQKSYVSHSRNVGISQAKGELIFLVDDDNVVDASCISHLVEAFRERPNVGLVGPMMYYLGEPNKIWCAGIDRSMVTSLTRIVGRDQVDIGQFSALTSSKDFPNAFMVRRSAIEAAGAFNERLFPIHYEESDLAERIRRAGFQVLLQPAAKDWHDIPNAGTEDKLRLLHIHDPGRAYFAGRNRVLFFRLYSRRYEKALFLLLFNWALAVYYLKTVLGARGRSPDDRIRLARGYVSGMFDGLRERLHGA